MKTVNQINVPKMYKWSELKVGDVFGDEHSNRIWIKTEVIGTYNCVCLHDEDCGKLADGGRGLYKKYNAELVLKEQI